MNSSLRITQTYAMRSTVFESRHRRVYCVCCRIRWTEVDACTHAYRLSIYFVSLCMMNLCWRTRRKSFVRRTIVHAWAQYAWTCLCVCVSVCASVSNKWWTSARVTLFWSRTIVSAVVVCASTKHVDCRGVDASLFCSIWTVATAKPRDGWFVCENDRENTHTFAGTIGGSISAESNWCARWGWKAAWTTCLINRVVVVS